MMNQLEKATGMDLNGDGRIGAGMGHPPQHNQYGSGYPQNYGQYGGAPGPQYNQYGPPGGGYPPNYGAPPGPQYNQQYGPPGYAPGPQNYGQYGPPGGYAPNPHQGGGGGGGLINQLEKATHMDLNGDGSVGGAGHGYNQYNRHY